MTRRYRRSNYRYRTNRRRYKRKPNVRQTLFRNLGNMTLSQAAYGAMKGVNLMRGIINSEKKRFDGTSSAAVITTPSIGTINAISAGDDANQRNGNSILAKYVRFQYRVVMDTTLDSVTTRIILFVDTQHTGTNPTATDLLQTTTSPGIIVSPINLDNTQRFTILFDDKVDLEATGRQVATREHYVPLNFHIRFTSTVDSSYNKNSIFVLAVSTAAATGPTLTYSSRLVFYDN